MIGIQMNFFIFFLISYALALTTTAVCVLLGSACTDPKMATAFFPLVIVPQLYFSGVFVATKLIPNWVRHVSWRVRVLD
jgi:ABC-type multidrug transport system permease subunit